MSYLVDQLLDEYETDINNLTSEVARLNKLLLQYEATIVRLKNCQY